MAIFNSKLLTGKPNYISMAMLCPVIKFANNLDITRGQAMFCVSFPGGVVPSVVAAWNMALVLPAVSSSATAHISK